MIYFNNALHRDVYCATLQPCEEITKQHVTWIISFCTLLEMFHFAPYLRTFLWLASYQPLVLQKPDVTKHWSLLHNSSLMLLIMYSFFIFQCRHCFHTVLVLSCQTSPSLEVTARYSTFPFLSCFSCLPKFPCLVCTHKTQWSHNFCTVIFLSVFENTCYR